MARAVKLSKRGSWHLVDPKRPAFTLCGRYRGEINSQPDLPGDQKTCERCAVIAVKRT